MTGTPTTPTKKGEESSPELQADRVQFSDDSGSLGPGGTETSSPSRPATTPGGRSDGLRVNSSSKQTTEGGSATGSGEALAHAKDAVEEWDERSNRYKLFRRIAITTVFFVSRTES